MIPLGGLFDLILAGTLVWLAWRLLATSDMFKAVVLFITFGLLMALAWVRLNAPDLALAEAVIGAGITGVLLLTVLSHLESDKLARQKQARLGHRSGRLILPLLAILPAALILLWLSSPLARTSGRMAARVMGLLDQSGTNHPVTAVLLNMRAYDTLLETAVLLLAVVAIWSFCPARKIFSAEPVLPAQQGLLRILLPVIVMTALYLLWRGSHAPGGAFQAAALLATGLLLALMSGLALPDALSRMPQRLLLAAGFIIFLAVAGVTLIARGTLLDYPETGTAGPLFLIETALTLSIGGLLAAAVVGGRPPGGSVEFPPRQRSSCGEAEK